MSSIKTISIVLLSCSSVQHVCGTGVRDFLYRGTEWCSQVELTNTQGNVFMRGWSRPYVKVYAKKHADSKRRLTKMGIRAQQVGSKLVVRSTWKKSLFNRGWSCIDYVIKVPKEADTCVALTRGNIRLCNLVGNHVLKTSNGSIVGERLGDVEATTSHGEINLKDVFDVNAQTSNAWLVIDGADNVDAYTSNASIMLKNISGVWNARNKNASIKLENISGDGQAQTSRADIVVKGCTGNNHVVTCYGDVSIVNSMNTVAQAMHGNVTHFREP